MDLLKALLKKLVPHLPYLAVIIVLAVLSPLSFFRDNLPQMSMDTWIPLHPTERLNNWVYVWDSFNYMLGLDASTRLPLLFPYVLTWAVLEQFGLNLVLIQKLIYIQIFMTAGLSMYYLSSTLFNKERIIGMIAALIFMFNPVTLGYWQSFLVEAVYGFASMPLTLGLIVRGVRSGRYLRYSILAALSTLLFPAINPPTSAILYLTAFAFGMYAVVTRPERDVPGALRFCAYFLGFIAAFNLWWLASMVQSIADQSAIYMKYSVIEKRLENSTLQSTLINNLRLFGNNNWGYSYWGDRVSNPIAFLYETSPWLKFASILYPVLAFSALFVKSKRTQAVFLAAVALIFIWLSKGTMPPFGNTYMWLYEKLPGFSIFRTPSDKMCIPVIVTYSLLIGISIEGFHHWLAAKKRLPANIAVVIATGAALAYVWPFFNGAAVSQGKGAVPSVNFDLPNYYEDAADWLGKKPDDFRIMSMPGANVPTRWLYFDWGFLGTYCVQSDIFGRPVIDKNLQDEGTSFRQAVYAALGDNRELEQDYLDVPFPAQVTPMLQMMGIKYIVLHDDVDPGHIHFGKVDPSVIEASLARQRGVSSSAAFGDLQFYEIEKPAPRIFSQHEAKLVIGDESCSMVRLADAGLLDADGVYLNSAQISADQLVRLSRTASMEPLFVDSNVCDLAVDLNPKVIAGQLQPNGLDFTVDERGDYEIYLPRSVIEDYRGTQVLLKADGERTRALTVPRLETLPVQKWHLMGVEELNPGKYRLSRGRFSDGSLLAQARIMPKKTRVAIEHHLAGRLDKDLYTYLITDLNLENDHDSLIALPGSDSTPVGVMALVKQKDRYITSGEDIRVVARLKPISIDTYTSFKDAKIKGRGVPVRMDPLELKIKPGGSVEIHKPLLVRNLGDSSFVTIKVNEAPNIAINASFGLDVEGNGEISRHYNIGNDLKPLNSAISAKLVVPDSRYVDWVKTMTIKLTNKGMRTQTVRLSGIEIGPEPSVLAFDHNLLEMQSGRYMENKGHYAPAGNQPKEKTIYDIQVDDGYRISGEKELTFKVTDQVVQDKVVCELDLTDEDGGQAKQFVTAYIKRIAGRRYLCLSCIDLEGLVLKELSFTNSRHRWSYKVDKMHIAPLVDSLRLASVDFRGVTLALERSDHIVKKQSDVSVDGFWHLGELQKRGALKIATRDTEKAKVAGLVLSNADQRPKSEPRGLTAHRLDPTRYRVELDAGDPTWLVFNDAFDDEWQIYKLEEGIRRKVDAVHVCVNGYANAWRLTDRRSGSYLIEYATQRTFEWSALVSASFILIALLALIIESERLRRNRLT